jgi:hypothetical protein
MVYIGQGMQEGHALICYVNSGAPTTAVYGTAGVHLS